MGSKPKKRGMVREKRYDKQVPVIKGKVMVLSPPPDIPSPGNPQPEDSGSSKNNSMCVGCPGHCCTELTPEITMYDVVRIMELEGKDIGSFLQFQEANDGDPTAFKANGQMLVMTLKFDDGSCIFLNRGSNLRCTIHDSKPAICAVYPIKFLWEGESGFMSRALCPQENLAKAKAAIPTKSLLDARWEWERHMEIVGDWNSLSKGDEDVTEFIKFAAREMEAEKTPLGSLLRKARRVFRKR